MADERVSDYDHAQVPGDEQEGYGFLTSSALRDAIALGKIRFTPSDRIKINPASVDITLGSQVRVYASAVKVGSRRWRSMNGSQLRPRWSWFAKVRAFLTGKVEALDSAKPELTHLLEIEPEGFVLLPGIGYLMHTAERVWTDSYVPVLDGKSSVGRLFLKIHETAGVGDRCFDGVYTLEVTVVQPVIVYAGMRIGQFRFSTVVGESESYQDVGHYVGAHACGPVASQSWKQIEEDGLLAGTIANR